MPGMPWIKLFTAKLDDLSLGRLPDHLWRFYVSLYLVAGECDAEGYLVNGSTPLSTSDLAWRLHVGEEQLVQDLLDLSHQDMVAWDDEIEAWYLAAFTDEQGRSQEERRDIWREQKRRQRQQKKELARQVAPPAPPAPAAQVPEAEEEPAPDECPAAECPPAECPDGLRTDSARTPSGVLLIVHPPEIEEELEDPPANAGGDRSRSSPSRKKAAGKGKPPKTSTPPAVMVFRQAANRYPPRGWYGDIVRVVGEAVANLEFWRQVVHAWIGLGWNPGNVQGMLDCFQRRELPQPRNGNGKQPRLQPATSLDDWIQQDALGAEVGVGGSDAAHQPR